MMSVNSNQAAVVEMMDMNETKLGMFFEELRAKSQFTQENGKNKTNIGLWSG
jgi:hypothetical protein